MMFALPAACLAMIQEAQGVQGGSWSTLILQAATVTSIVTGITEPIEFAFLFAAPLLFVVHIAC